MFIPYRGPSKKKDTNTRRAINAFVATEASTRRRKQRGEEPEHRGRQVTLQWLQIPNRPDSQEPIIDERDESREDDRKAQRKPWTQAMVVSTPVGAGKFYPFGGFSSKGPLTARALSYYFDILLPHDANALGLGEVARDHSAADSSIWNVRMLPATPVVSSCTIGTRSCWIYTAACPGSKVDDVLLQGMALLIWVDDYLGHYEFGPVHLNGVREVVKLHGGFDAVGSSDENSFGRSLRMSLLVIQSMVEFHVQTAIINGPTLLANWELGYPLPVSGDAAQDLPGFRDLARHRYLSEEAIGIVRDFSHWLTRSQESESTVRQTWRCSMSCDLNNLEKCICVTLACLADDLSAMGTHPAALIFRKPQRGAEVSAAIAEV
ncbi:hypothetical protein Aspvir_007013 [Aspergillus viridinutans]|uniref:Uncharacterized protein n=1 Tax=Aspergillus viridinutans TaxID=75553 RepID=A0A9P3BUX3_ASPVI|nr:uncharacterized protein Aspvir_007013 [Aspergillus viridinutans]GIK02948.1 hypothetical protein Aspvir_007013 [Aspergillus viridinutans]